jgi:pyrimidine-specific ribonucleoside hydrolase
MNYMLDVDTGYDDALAIMLAVRTMGARLIGITCVAGNHTLPQVVRNTLHILDVVDAPISIPVAGGCILPLVEAVRPPAALHGRDGMADLGLPQTQRQAVADHAVELLREKLTSATAPVTLIALAPLTNIALFLRLYPHLHSKIARIVIMGGTHIAQGNTSPNAEFNIRADPEAAFIVISSGVPITLYPLDPFRQIHIAQDTALAMQKDMSYPVRIAGRICSSVMQALGRTYALIGDAGAVAVALDPSHATIERFPVSVELNGVATRGMTVVDRRTPAQRALLTEWWHVSPHECEVVTMVDGGYYKDKFLRALG